MTLVVALGCEDLIIALGLLRFRLASVKPRGSLPLII